MAAWPCSKISTATAGTCCSPRPRPQPCVGSSPSSWSPARPCSPLPVLAQAAAPLRVLYLDQSVGWKHAPVARPADGGLGAVRDRHDRHRPGKLAPSPPKSRRTPVRSRRNAWPRWTCWCSTPPAPCPFRPKAWAAVQQRVAAGKLGFVGLHSATDTGWPYGRPRRDLHPLHQRPFRRPSVDPGHADPRRDPGPRPAADQHAGSSQLRLRRGDLPAQRLRPVEGAGAADPGLRRHAAEAALRRADRLGAPDRPGPAVLHQPGPHALDLERSPLSPRRSSRPCCGPAGASTATRSPIPCASSNGS